jgi:hypothetical protein
MKIEGVPDGWEIVRFAKPKKGEYFLDEYRMPVQAESDNWHHPKLIIRKIERPKQYRPFANAEEFKPHRDRWWRYKESQGQTLNRHIRPPSKYNDDCYDERTWQRRFCECEFDDGTPFGMEVSE